MAKDRLSGLAAVGVAALVLLGTALGVAIAGLPHTDVSARPSEEIVRSIEHFEGVQVSDLRLMPSWPGTNLGRVRSGNTEYGFNPQSKEIESVLYGDNIGGEGRVSISWEQARATATNFAQKHCDNLPIFTLRNSGLTGSDAPISCTPTGTDGYYGFEWVQVIDGALTPNCVVVDVNAETGKVISYIRRYQPIEPTAPPRLSIEDAKAIVASRVLETAGAVSAVESEVSFLQDPELRIIVKDGRQMLVWRTTAEALGELPWRIGGQYDVDAQNGSIVEEDPFL